MIDRPGLAALIVRPFAHSRHQRMKKALKQLINALDKVFEEHEEVGDTAVREQM